MPRPEAPRQGPLSGWMKPAETRRAHRWVGQANPGWLSSGLQPCFISPAAAAALAPRRPEAVRRTLHPSSLNLVSLRAVVAVRQASCRSASVSGMKCKYHPESRPGATRHRACICAAGLFSSNPNFDRPRTPCGGRPAMPAFFKPVYKYSKSISPDILRRQTGSTPQ